MHKKTKRTESQYIWGVHRGVFWAVYFFCGGGGEGCMHLSKALSLPASPININTQKTLTEPRFLLHFPASASASANGNAVRKAKKEKRKTGRGKN